MGLYFESDTRHQAASNLKEFLLAIQEYRIEPKQFSQPTLIDSMHVGSLCQGVELIQVLKIPNEVGTICLVDNNYFQITNRSLDSTIHNLRKSLNGNEFETDVTNLSRKQPKPNWKWNNWRDSLANQVYQTQIYPMVTSAAIKIMDGSFDFEKKVVLADIFGADGLYLEYLANQLSELRGSQPFEFYLVDKNKAQTEVAKLREKSILQILPNSNYTVIRKDCVKSPLPMKQKPDISILIGGLNQEVLNKKDALKCLDQMWSSMNLGSFIVVTGFTECLVNARNFEEAGFYVHNMTYPGSIKLGTIPNYPLYIAQKV